MIALPSSTNQGDIAVENKEFVFIIVCASCVKPYGLEGVDLIKNAEAKPGSFLGELLMKRQGLTF